MIRVFQGSSSEQSKEPQTVYIDAGVRYIRGGEAEYLKKGSIEEENGQVVYNINRSTTNIVTIHLGVCVSF